MPKKMSDFSFLRSGFDQTSVSSEVALDADFMRMVVSLMTILCEEALTTAGRFATACGRSVVTKDDTVKALKYESHFFWDKDIDERFMARLQEERQHTYETDSGTDSEDADDNSVDAEDDADADEAPYTQQLQMPEHRQLYESILRVEAEWDSWDPQDPVKLLLKRSIDKTSLEEA